MCVVSAVSDYYSQPLRSTNQPYQTLPQWDDETKRLLREALERLDKIDKKLGDIECKDDKKAAFLQSLGMSLD